MSVCHEIEVHEDKQPRIHSPHLGSKLERKTVAKAILCLFVSQYVSIPAHEYA